MDIKVVFLKHKRVRVLHGVVRLNPSDGGPARSIPALASATAAADAEVIVCCQHRPEIELAEFPGVNFQTGDIGRLAAEFRPHIIHDHGIWLRSNHRAVRAARRHGARLVISPRGMLQKWCLKHHRYKKLIAWHLYQARDLSMADALHATSDGEAASLKAIGFNRPIIRLPNGVTLPRTVPSNSPRTGVHRLVFVSRIHPVKGLINLIHAWADLRPPNWQLDIFGPSEIGHREKIEELISLRGLRGSVNVDGALDNPAKWNQLMSADAVVLPSFSENFGIVVAESLSAGTPVLTTTGTPWKGLTDNQCGWWVSPDIAGIKHGLKEVFATPRSTLQAMGRRGREWVQRDFLWSGIGEQMLDAYEWLLNPGARPDCVDHQQTKADEQRAA